MIRENLSLLKSFDQNKDDLIDEEELSKAMETTRSCLCIIAYFDDWDIFYIKVDNICW